MKARFDMVGADAFAIRQVAAGRGECQKRKRGLRK
jgi:hypothetical protein